VDADKDGYITPWELETALQKIKDHMSPTQLKIFVEVWKQTHYKKNLYTRLALFSMPFLIIYIKCGFGIQKTLIYRNNIIHTSEFITQG
jgi:hypothetical protein